MPGFQALEKEGAPAAGRGFACLIGSGPDFFLAARRPRSCPWVFGAPGFSVPLWAPRLATLAAAAPAAGQA